MRICKDIIDYRFKVMYAFKSKNNSNAYYEQYILDEDVLFFKDKAQFK